MRLDALNGCVLSTTAEPNRTRSTLKDTTIAKPTSRGELRPLRGCGREESGPFRGSGWEECGRFPQLDASLPSLLPLAAATADIGVLSPGVLSLRGEAHELPHSYQQQKKTWPSTQWCEIG